MIDTARTVDRTELERELRALDEQDEQAERARRQRQARRAEIQRELGWLSAIEAMVANIPRLTSAKAPEGAVGVVGGGVGAQTLPSIQQHGTNIIGDDILSIGTGERGPYGQAINTVREVLCTNPDRAFNPVNIKEEAVRQSGIVLKIPSIRSALRRMVREEEATKRGGRYMWSSRRLPLQEHEPAIGTTPETPEADGNDPSASD